MKKIIHLTLFLAIISALAGGVLGFVNQITSPIIAEKKIAAVKASLQEIFPGATEFAEITIDENDIVVKAYEATGAGYAFNVSVQGYKDVIEFIVGIDTTGKIVGLQMNYVNDTPGLGTKVAESEFINSIVNKNIDDKLDTISGSTISSKAVIKGIDAAIAVFESLK
jgi:electron transport complex protein RnfG